MPGAMAAGKAVSWSCGWSRVRSDRFTVERVGVERAGAARLRFRGQGEGHGVGLCEEGAADLARRGLDYRAILGRYFPGAAVAARPPDDAP